MIKTVDVLSMGWYRSHPASHCH